MIESTSSPVRPLSGCRLIPTLGLSVVALGLMACGLSEDELAKGKERAALAAEQSKIVAEHKSSKGCIDAAKALDGWKAEHKDAISTSDAWWNGLSEGTKDKVYEKYPAFSQANKDRASLLVFCGSDKDLWDPSS